MFKAKLVTFMLCLSLVACVSTKAVKASFTGEWLLTTNNGTTHQITITQISPELILMDAEEIFLSGHYQVDDGYITLIEANQPRIENVEFTLAKDGNYYVTKAPVAARLSAQLKGSRLAPIRSR